MFHLSATLLQMKSGQFHIPWYIPQSWHGIFWNLWPFFASPKNVRWFPYLGTVRNGAFVDLPENTRTVSLAIVWNSDSCIIHSRSAKTDSSLLYSNTQRWYLANIGSGILPCNFIYSEPSPSSWCWPASFRLIIAMSKRSAKSSISFALPGRICGNCSNSWRYIAICLRLPPYFLSNLSFAAS